LEPINDKRSRKTFFIARNSFRRKQHKKRVRHARNPYTNYGHIQSWCSYSKGTEMKHLDVSVGPYTLTTSLNGITPSSYIAGGSTASTRVGNVIRLRHIEIKIVVTPGDLYNLCQSWLLLTPNGQQNFPAASITVPPDDDAFVILEQRLFTIGTATRGAYPLTMRHTFPGQGLTIHYDTNLGNSEIMNRIMYVMVCDSSVLPNPTYQGYIRMWYTDK